MRSVWVKNLESVNSKSAEEIRLLTSCCNCFSRKMKYLFNHYEYYQNLYGDWIIFRLLLWTRQLFFRCHLAVTKIFLPVFLGTEDVNEIQKFRSKQSLIFLPNLKLTAICSWIRKWGVGFYTDVYSRWFLYLAWATFPRKISARLYLHSSCVLEKVRPLNFLCIVF